LKRSADPVQLLFTDVVLPNGMNGTILAQHATALRPELKVLFTTGYERDAVFPDARSHMRADMIRKPFTFANLATKVRNILDNTPEQGQLGTP
jgi:DNA-binding NtrC family response regulator